MLILSQDKKGLINLDNVTKIGIIEPDKKIEEFMWLIYADSNSVESKCFDLGYYLTEERANQVLQEIIKNYKKANISGHSLGYGYVGNNIYEMPEE